MKKIEDYYIEFGEQLIKQEKIVCLDTGWKKGIKAYVLQRKDSIPSGDTEKIAKLLLKQFKGISAQNYIAFFDKYDIRERITKIANKCDLLSEKRMLKGKVISKEEYQQLKTDFLAATFPLLDDTRYQSWLRRIREDTIMSLENASGRNEVCNMTVQERIKRRKRNP